jgi:hypothetical protein
MLQAVENYVFQQPVCLLNPEQNALKKNWNKNASLHDGRSKKDG